MRKLLIISTVALLSACSISQVASSLGDLQLACNEYAVAETALNGQLKGGALATAISYEASGDAFCKYVQKGVIPANADSNTIPWLAAFTSALNTFRGLM